MIHWYAVEILKIINSLYSIMCIWFLFCRPQRPNTRGQDREKWKENGSFLDFNTPKRGQINDNEYDRYVSHNFIGKADFCNVYLQYMCYQYTVLNIVVHVDLEMSFPWESKDQAGTPHWVLFQWKQWVVLYMHRFNFDLMSIQ